MVGIFDRLADHISLHRQRHFEGKQLSRDSRLVLDMRSRRRDKGILPMHGYFYIHMGYVPHTTSQIPVIPDEQLTRGTRPGVDPDPQ